MIIYKVTKSYDAMTSSSEGLISNTLGEWYFDSKDKAEECQKELKEKYQKFNEEHFFDEDYYEQYRVDIERIIVR